MNVNIRPWSIDEASTLHALADDVDVGGAGIEPRGGSHAGVATVGYWLGKAYWGRGIATAALRKVVERTFAMGYRRAEATFLLRALPRRECWRSADSRSKRGCAPHTFNATARLATN